MSNLCFSGLESFLSIDFDFVSTRLEFSFDFSNVFVLMIQLATLLRSDK